MKLTSLQENLKNGLFVVSNIAGKNVNLPILNNILIEAKKEKITFSATDLEIGIINQIRGKVEKEGTFTVESKLLHDCITLLPNKKVDLELKGNGLKVLCDNFSTNIKGQEAEEFPLIPSIEEGDGYRVDLSNFKKALSQVVFAVSTSETRVELTGVLFIFEGNKLTLVSTDSYRLAEKNIEISEGKKDTKVIVPAKTAQEVIRILSHLKESDIDEKNKEVKIKVSENQIMFEINTIKLVSRLIEGNYPDYKQIIPKKENTKIVISKKEFLRAVKVSSLFSKEGVNDINLDFPRGKNKMVITSASGQAGDSVNAVDAVVKGDDNGIAINYKYLLDGINGVDSEYICIDIIDANTPCVVKPENDKSFIYVIMPIKQ